MDRILPTVAPLLARVLKSRQALREAQFAAVPQTPGRVIFLGDSITEWTAWEDWFPELRTANRGIGGQAIRDVLARLDSAVVAPRAISLLIGTNDLHGLGKSMNVPEIAAHMDTLVRRIRELAPSAALFVNSVLPRSTHFRDRIVQLNKEYQRIAAGYDAVYVDAWSALAGEDGAIRSEFTTDGLHLSIEGYNAWVAVLRPHLVRFAS
ncbi:GDSL-type esterase/lipase family protein [Novosphingobium endophyticum]|nr:GDSL-type esterase/lipase family protein [Novosphingobium endophyticum]